MHELRVGAEKSENPLRAHDRLGAFLAPLRILPFDEEAAVASARVRGYLEKSGNKIGALDNLIAGHAISARHILVTNNVNEFTRVPGLIFENWIEP